MYDNIHQELEENREAYHGNNHIDPSRNTINLYLCPGDNSELSATNIRENCNRSQLMCDTNFAKDDPNINQLQVREGWILVTRSGSTGIVSSVPKAWDGFAISEHVIRIIPDEKILPKE